MPTRHDRELRHAAELAALGISPALAAELSRLESKAGNIPDDVSLIPAAAGRFAQRLSPSFFKPGDDPHALAAELEQLRDSLIAEREAAVPARRDLGRMLRNRGFEL